MGITAGEIASLFSESWQTIVLFSLSGGYEVFSGTAETLLEDDALSEEEVMSIDPLDPSSVLTLNIS